MNTDDRGLSACRILIADDYPLVRRGLREYLSSQPGIEICGEASNGRESVELAATETPDLVIMDLTMPEMEGLEAIRLIRQTSPKTKILVLTMHTEEEFVRDSLNSGAHGYILKSEAVPELLSAIDHLRNGGAAFLSESLRSATPPFMFRPMRRAPANRALTEREIEVVRLLANGSGNRAIANDLHISVRTVEVHRNHIMKKLGASGVSHIVRFAVRNGLISA